MNCPRCCLPCSESQQSPQSQDPVQKEMNKTEEEFHKLIDETCEAIRLLNFSFEETLNELNETSAAKDKNKQALRELEPKFDEFEKMIEEFKSLVLLSDPQEQSEIVVPFPEIPTNQIIKSETKKLILKNKLIDFSERSVSRKDSKSSINTKETKDEKIDSKTPFWKNYYKYNQIKDIIATNVVPYDFNYDNTCNETNKIISKNMNTNDGIYKKNKVLVKRRDISEVNFWVKSSQGYIPLEVELLRKVENSKYFLQFLDCSIEPAYCAIIMKSIKNVIDLSILSNKLNGLNEYLARYFFGEIIKACLELKNFKVLHLDIRPENVLIDFDFGVKIINFESAIDYTSDLINKKIGSERYAPPEYWSNNSFYADSATVWMIGLSLYSTLFLKYPSNKPIEILNTDIEFNDNEAYPFRNDFLQKCLVKNPNNRPKLEELLNHEWFKKEINLATQPDYVTKNLFKKMNVNTLKFYDKDTHIVRLIEFKDFNPIEADIIMKVNTYDFSLRLLDLAFKCEHELCYFVYEPLDRYYILSQQFDIKDEKDVIFYLKQLIEICSHLKKMNILNLDFDIRKMIITRIDNKLKLIDFGSCCFWNNNEYFKIENSLFRPPELELTGCFNPDKALAYSIGIFTHMLTEPEEYEINEKKVEFSKEFHSFLMQMIEKDSEKRLSFDQIIEHSFISNN